MELHLIYTLSFELPLAFSYVCRDLGVNDCERFAMKMLYECGGDKSSVVRPAAIGYNQFRKTFEGLADRGVRPREEIYYMLLGEVRELANKCGR